MGYQTVCVLQSCVLQLLSVFWRRLAAACCFDNLINRNERVAGILVCVDRRRYGRELTLNRVESGTL
jgi:ribosome biogenesis protein Tsr3